MTLEAVASGAPLESPRTPLLVLDQSSQADHTPERDQRAPIDGLPTQHQTAVRQLFSCLHRYRAAREPQMQIIVAGHVTLLEHLVQGLDGQALAPLPCARSPIAVARSRRHNRTCDTHPQLELSENKYAN